VAEPIIRTAKRKPGLPASARPCPIHLYTRARTSTFYLSIYLPLTSELHAQPTHSAASGFVGLPETCRRNRNGRDNAFIEKRHVWATEITMAQFTTKAGGKYETARVAFTPSRDLKRRISKGERSKKESRPRAIHDSLHQDVKTARGMKHRRKTNMPL